LWATLFLVATTLTLLAIQKWRSKQTNATSPPTGSMANIPGLAEGDTVNFAELPTLQNEYVDLKTVKNNYILCAFISTECEGCAQDVQFWKELKKEIDPRNVAFYVVSVDVDQSRVQRFATAHEFEDLPVLFDPNRQALTAFKIQFVPQYVLLMPSGKVIARWNGIRRYDPEHESATDKLEGLLKYISTPLASAH